MVHPYTTDCPTFSYVGRHSYLLTFVTYDRIRAFADAKAVSLVLTQFVRGANERQFEVIAYCFMPDHVHLVVTGLGDQSNLKTFVRAAKQYSGFYYAQVNGRAKLWQHGKNDHIIRDGGPS